MKKTIIISIALCGLILIGSKANAQFGCNQNTQYGGWCTVEGDVGNSPGELSGSFTVPLGVDIQVGIVINAAGPGEGGYVEADNGSNMWTAGTTDYSQFVNNYYYEGGDLGVSTDNTIYFYATAINSVTQIWGTW